jgi:hypothetical protein
MAGSQLSSRDRERIPKYVELDEENLYSVLATYAEELSGAVFDPARQREAGRKIFEKLEPGLRAQLCDEWGLCAKLEDASVKDATSLVVVVGDVISAGVIGFPPFLIASLLVKIGLRRFCKC